MAVDLSNNTTYLDHVREQSDLFVNTLNTLASSYNWTTLYPLANIGTAPTINADTYQNNISGYLTDMDSYITSIEAISSPSFVGVDAPNLSTYNQPIWSEAYWTTLKTKVLTFLDTNTSLTETDAMQNAMYQKDLSRRQQTLRDLYSAANSNTSAKGFLFPTSLTTALKLDAQQKYQFDAVTASRDIYKFVIEWAKSNYQYALTKTIDAHQADVEFNTKYASVLIESYKTQVQMILEKYKEQILAEAAKIDAYAKKILSALEMYKTADATLLEKFKSEVLSAVEGYKKTVEISTVQNKLNLEQVNVRVSAATSAITGLAALTKGIADIRVQNN